MVPFIIAILAVLAALAGLFAQRAGTRAMAKAETRSATEDAVLLRRAGRIVAVVSVALTVLFGFLSSFTTVQANSVGIVTAFGRPVGTVTSGGHFLAPWDNVDTFSTQVQVTQRLAGPQGDVPGADCIQVNLKGGANACADVTIRFVINPSDAVDLWKRYGDFGTVRDKLLRSATDNAAKIVYGQYAPQDAISGDAIPAITTGLEGELGKQLDQSGLTLVAVAPGQLHLDPQVQQRINDILNAQTGTAVAKENLAKNQAEAQANDALAGSLSPQILVQQCIQAAEVIKPSVFTCLGGTSATPLVTVPGH